MDVNSVANFPSGAAGTIPQSYSLFSFQRALELIQNLTATTQCVGNIKRLVTSVQNESWAFSFFDSSGKPGPSITQGWLNFVGNFDQCRDIVVPPSGESNGFKGNYCVLRVDTPRSPVQTQIGTCFPDTCSSAEIQEFLSGALNETTTNLKSVECLTTETEVTKATVFAIIILVVIGCLMIIGTLLDIFIIQLPKWRHSSTSHPSTRGEHRSNNARPQDKANIYGETLPLLPKESTRKNAIPCSTTAKVVPILVAFSVYSNGIKILNVSQTNDSLKSLHGVRFLSMCWVILGHTYFFGIKYMINVTTQLPIYVHRWTFDAVANSYVSVDTFFSISGLLVSYLTIKKFTLAKSWKINWPMFYFHRFWRLTPPYASILVIVLGLQQYMGQGPLWANDQPPDKKACETNWWANLLYINNLKTSGGFCMRITWYLANDTQFYMLSPLMLIPFHFHRIAGLASCLVFLLTSWITAGVLSSGKHWDAHERITGDQVWFEDYYIKPWNRIGPFVIGIVAGYILTQVKGRQLRFKWWVVALGWIVASAAALSVLYGTHGDISGDNPSSNDAAALYNAVARSVWGASVCWVIIACEAGHGGPVTVLLSWPPLIVLGRLTYMMYLIHATVIDVFYQNLGMPYYTNDTTMVIFYIGIFGFSGLAAFVLMLGFESPMIGLEKIFITNR